MKQHRNPRISLAGALSLLLVLVLYAVTAGAQTPAPVTNNDRDINRTELNNFDRYLDDHPNTARELRSNPNLVRDPGWMAEHPGLQSFLKQHPGVNEEFRENPSQFMGRENRFERNGGDVTRAEAAKADNYLDGHPNVSRQLQQNPKLVDNPQYLASHPGLSEFLQKHPEVKQDWKEHPNAFMKREKQYEKHEGKDR